MSFASISLVTLLGILLGISSLPSDNSHVGEIKKFINANIKIIILLIVLAYTAIAFISAGEKYTENKNSTNRQKQIDETEKSINNIKSKSNIALELIEIQYDGISELIIINEKIKDSLSLLNKDLSAAKFAVNENIELFRKLNHKMSEQLRSIAVENESKKPSMLVGTSNVK